MDRTPMTSQHSARFGATRAYASPCAIGRNPWFVALGVMTNGHKLRPRRFFGIS